MIDEEKKDGAADGGEAGTDTGTDTDTDTDGDDEDGDGDDTGEAARTKGQPVKVTILKDPRTGKPLRDQTPAAEDTGYLGNHVMQDRTEHVAPEKKIPESDFKE